ncbi:MAG: trypsin-like peptidase domain-containing protein [Actinobacteria bacterium]|nr:trypsin-like peptidase domain-containing protein [Actinomycetota bacterium]
MATLIGFGSHPTPPNEPSAPAPHARLRPAAILCTLLLLLPLSTPTRGDAALAARPASGTGLGQVHPKDLTIDAIETRLRPALYSVVETFPEHQSAFAFANFENVTLLATTYQNLLRASNPDIRHELGTSSFPFYGGARVDPSFPVHQVLLVRHGSVIHRAQVVNADFERDVAVVKIPGSHPVAAPECQGEQSPRIGDRTWAFSVGPNVSGSAPSRSFGRIAAFQPPEQIQSGQKLPRFGEGGPLVNVRGNVIGVSARGVDVSALRGTTQGYTMSVDINTAMDLAGLPNTCSEEEAAVEERPPPANRLNGEGVAEAVLPAVVSIESVDSDVTFPPCEGNCNTSGSGFGVHSDGTSTWIATNHHVLGNARFLTRPTVIVRKDDIAYQAEIVASDRVMDVALVRVNAVFPTLATDCSGARPGEMVAAAGSPGDAMFGDRQRFPEQFQGAELNPFFLHPPGADFVVGPVSLNDQPLMQPGFGFAPWNDKGQFETVLFAQTFDDLPGVWDVLRPATTGGYGLPHGSHYGYLPDSLTFGRIRAFTFKDVRHTAAIYHGNSGGPLVNMQGQVVGINQRFGKRGARIAINVKRLFGRLSSRAGIPDPCAGQPAEPPDGEGEGGGTPDPPAATQTPSASPAPELSPTAEPTVVPTGTAGG